MDSKAALLVVAIETSSAVGSVALSRGPELIAERTFRKGARHGRDLVPSLHAAFREHGLAPADTALVAVGVGPGSYTGLRVGLATAKALCFALGCPCVAVNSFDAMVQNVAAQSDGTASVVVDARRGNIYSARYKSENGKWLRVDGPAVSEPGRVADRLAPGTIVLGDAIAKYPSLFDGFETTPPEMWTPRAAAVTALGYAAYASGSAADAESIRPEYLRAPAAVEKARGEGTAT